jgi:hypothetical protein
VAEEMLTIDERRKYLKRMQPRYQRSDRVGRGALLTEMEAVTGPHRKSLTRLLRAPTLASRVAGSAGGPTASRCARWSRWSGRAWTTSARSG